ncbi:ASCH domain-containing protein [Dyadobacter fermentans]|uniref:ASCH domain-containing protein n=1 Tax=Dyadobacter fermentans TaxID=94254 RepID=UPI001CBBD112|nr:ASCH domain-containing protein [Dyadobacter fermentans]MBZ1362157.1 ASCH domain-containing protein [Dyadobacter fermentans]
MKAITLQQPWAGLLVLGVKTCETRSWNTHYRGKIAVHSSAKIPAEGKKLFEQLCELKPEIFYEGSRAWELCTTTGHVLGTVTIEQVYSTNKRKPSDEGELMLGDYSPNRYWFWCIRPETYQTPIPASGQLMIWEWDENQERF